jgi:hypothetical protein
MKKRSFAALLVAAIVLTGCASAGNQTLKDADQQQIDQRIIAGKTTKADVIAYLGNAESISFTDSGNEIWTFTYARAQAKGVNFIPVVGAFIGGQTLHKKQTVILFDARGVVKKATFSDTTDEVRTGLAN